MRTQDLDVHFWDIQSLPESERQRIYETAHNELRSDKDLSSSWLRIRLMFHALFIVAVLGVIFVVNLFFEINTLLVGVLSGVLIGALLQKIRLKRYANLIAPIVNRLANESTT